MVSWIFFHFRWSESKKKKKNFLIKCFSCQPIHLPSFFQIWDGPSLLRIFPWSTTRHFLSWPMTDQPAALGLNGLKTFDAWWSSPAAFKSPHQSGFFLRAGPPRRGQSGLVWSEQPVHTILAGCMKHDLRRHRINNPGSVLLTGATYYITLGKSVHHFRVQSANHYTIEPHRPPF